MNHYKELYNESIVSAKEINSVLETIQKPDLSWENYYWGVKCLIKHSEEAVAPDIITDALENADKSGLTYERNKVEYLDAAKIKSSYYVMYGKYNLAGNELQCLFDHTDPPAWVYHDFVSVNTHISGQLERMLVSPQKYIDSINKVDPSNDFNEEKQKNIFKEFLTEAASHIVSGNFSKKISSINSSLLSEEAKFLSLSDGFEWFNFQNALAGRALISQEEWDQLHPAKETEETSSSDNEISELRRLLEEKSKKLTASTKKLSEARKNIKKLETDLKDAEFRYTEMVSGFEQREESLKENYQNEINQYTLRISTLEEQLTEAEKKLKSAGKTQDTNSVVSKRLQAEIDRLTIEIDSVNKAMQKLKDEKGKEIATLKAEKKTANQNYQHYKSLYDDLSDKLDEKDKAISDLQKTHEIYKNIYAGRIVGEIYEYIFCKAHTVTAKWIKSNLPKISKNWWEECVLNTGILGTKDTQKLQAKSSTDVVDLDIAVQIKTIKEAYYKYPGKIYLNGYDFKTITDMLNLRNNWAHSTPKEIKGNANKAIETLLSFFEALSADANMINELRQLKKSMA